ncbi:MAG TPA: host attachment family protein [Rhizomicrobium sp.]|jgi:protein required for attachment to host cells|nr:host attachment family protein [Rhizomicrobium sp.]
MAKHGLEHNAWVLICDGGKAILAENAGDAQAPNLEVRETFEHPDPPTREQGTDKPGRIFAGIGEARSATEPTDFHALAEENFLRKVASRVERLVGERHIQNLIVVAPPRAIGVLRRKFSPTVRNVLRHEVEKDYVHLPMYEVERHLLQQLHG